MLNNDATVDTDQYEMVYLCYIQGGPIFVALTLSICEIVSLLELGKKLQ